MNQPTYGHTKSGKPINDEMMRSWPLKPNEATNPDNLRAVAAAQGAHLWARQQSQWNRSVSNPHCGSK